MEGKLTWLTWTTVAQQQPRLGPAHERTQPKPRNGIEQKKRGVVFFSGGDSARRSFATSSPTIRSTPDVVSHSRTSPNLSHVRVYLLAPRFTPNPPQLSPRHPGHCRRRGDELDLVMAYKYAQSSALKP